MTARLPRLLRQAACATLALLGACTAAFAQTYTSGSAVYAFIDSSSHTKIGYNTTPYKFNASSGCGTTPPVLDDTLSDAIPIGFTFKFGSTNYTTAYVMTNGRLQFGNTTCGSGTQNTGPPQTYPYGYPNTSMNATMKVFGVDLDPTNLVDKPNYPTASNKTPCASIASCYVSVATLGTAPSRQFVVTWKGVPEWVNTSKTSGGFDLQIILNEDGSFVYQYGNNFSHGGTGTAQVGWQISSSDYQVLSFGASVEPSANSAIKFFLPAPIAVYTFDEGAWVPGTANQVLDSAAAARHGSAVGDAQTVSTGKVCRAADIPANSGGSLNAVRTGIDLGNSALSLQGTGTIAFWYRANSAWNGGTSAQLLDATSVNGEWFFLSKTAAGALVFEIRDSTGITRQVSSAAQGFAANTWVHVAVSWNFNGAAGSNQDSLQITVNAGTPTAAAFTSSGSITSLAGVLHLGGNSLGAADTLGSLNSADGQLDEAYVYNYVLTQAQVATVMNTTRSCPTLSFDHLEIQHASGTGLTCTPSTVTVRACANAACSTLYTGGVAGQLSPSGGSPNVNWDGSSGGSGAHFAISAGSSATTKSLQITQVGSRTLGIASTSVPTTGSNSCNFGSPSCSFSAADSGFVLAVPNHGAETSQTLAISAVRKSDNSLACTPAFANVSKPVNLRCSYADPASGTLPARVGGTPLNASASAAAACDATGATVNLAFDASGVARTPLLYADVGRLNLLARYAPTSGLEASLVMNGATSVVVRPAGFTLSAIRCTLPGSPNCAAASGNNPGATDATGAAFIGAGRSFSVTASAVNGVGTTTPNYGRESAPEGVKLTASLVAPSGGVNAGLANPSGFGSFSAGVATGTAFSWPEVGIITLTPSVADADYLGSGDVTGSASSPVGRFIPAGFAVSGASLTQRSDLACAPASAFTYLDENFRLGFTLTAQTLLGATTRNYTGSFAKLDLSNPAGLNLAGIQGSTMLRTGNSRLQNVGSSGSWSAGVAASVTLTAKALRATTPDGPFDSAQFGIAPQDGDGARLLLPTLDTDSPANGADSAPVGTIPLRYGRLRIQNGIAAANRPLNLPLVAQYWNGSIYITNTLDSCTRIKATDLSFGNLRRSLVPTDAAMSGSSTTLAVGIGRLTLAAPASGHVGSLDLALALDATNPPADQSCLRNVQGWTPDRAATTGANLKALRSNWCGSAASDPAARATWGLYRGADGVVYQRENY